MSRYVQLVTLVAAVVFAATTSICQAAALPDLVCRRPVFDFGECDNAGTVEHTFRIENRGNAPATISGLFAPCGCYVFDISRTNIPPGGTANLKARLILRGLTGNIAKVILIRCDNPGDQCLRVEMKGTATSAIEVRPRLLYFNSIRSEPSQSLDVEVVCREGVSAFLTNAACSSPRFAVDQPVKLAEGRWRVRVSTVAPLPEGEHRASVEIRTTHPKLPKLTFRVAATVVGDVLVNPSEISVREGARAPVTRTVFVRGNEGVGVKVIGASSPLPDVTVNVIEWPAGQYRVVVGNLAPSPDIDGKCVTISTDFPGRREILVPIRLIRGRSPFQEAD